MEAYLETRPNYHVETQELELTSPSLLLSASIHQKALDSDAYCLSRRIKTILYDIQTKKVDIGIYSLIKDSALSQLL